MGILDVKPNVVTTDLTSYKFYIYGAGGIGKSTLCSQFPKSLILASEPGCKAIPGAMVYEISKWSELKRVLRELDKAEAKAMYSTICLDTYDLFCAYATKYWCNQLGIENIGDGGWAVNGWDKVKREVIEVLNSIAMKGYGVVITSHDKEKTFKRKDGTEYNQIVPSASAVFDSIAREWADLQIYCSIEGGKRYMTFRAQDDTIECKSRFAYIEPKIEFGYKSLEAAIAKAIDTEAKQYDNKFLTSEKKTTQVVEYNFEEYVQRAQTIIGNIMNAVSEEDFNTKYAPQIVKITSQYLNGKKISECTPEQVEQLVLVVDALEQL